MGLGILPVKMESTWGCSRIVFVIIVMVILPSLKQIHGIGDKVVFCRYCIILRLEIKYYLKLIFDNN